MSKENIPVGEGGQPMIEEPIELDGKKSTI